jgi:hypothetical protein
VTGVPAVAAPDGPVAGLLLPVNGPVRVAVIDSQVGPGTWRWPPRWVDTVGGHPVVWCGERRNVADLPANTAAWVLAARLGCADLAERIGLNGDLLLAGIGPDGRACEVPELVVEAARGAGILDQHAGGPADRCRAVGAGTARAGLT